MFGSACGNQPGGALGGGGGHPLMQFLQHKKGWGRQCGGPGALLKDLDLSDEQIERIAGLKVGGLGQFAHFKSVLAELMPKLTRELAQDSIDKNKVKEVYQQIKTHKDQLGENMVTRIIEFAEVLTPAQRKKLRMSAIKHFLGLNVQEEE